MGYLRMNIARQKGMNSSDKIDIKEISVLNISFKIRLTFRFLFSTFRVLLLFSFLPFNVAYFILSNCKQHPL